MLKLDLKRELGLFEVTLAGIGIILGAGIYALIGKAAAIAGMGVWVSFLIAAILAAFTGLSYAELSALFPKAGAEYVYTNQAFGRRAAFIIGWLVIIGGVIASAAVALGFGGYLFALLGIETIIGALILLVAVSLLLCYGVKESAQAAIIGTLIEAAGLILIIWIALPYLGTVDYFDFPDVMPILSGAALVFFAFIGFEEMSRMAGEVKNPQKVMPKAILLAIAFTTILYMLVSISAVSVLTPQELGASEAPLAAVAEKALGMNVYFIIAIIALFATANTVLMLQFAASRITYGMTKKYKSISLLSWLHPNRRTPWNAITFVTILGLGFVFIGGIEMVAYLTDFTVFMAFVAVNLSLIWLRYKQPKLKRPFKVPTLAIPILGALTSFLILFTMPVDVMGIGFLLLALGLILYEIVDRKKN